MNDKIPGLLSNGSVSVQPVQIKKVKKIQFGSFLSKYGKLNDDLSDWYLIDSD